MRFFLFFILLSSAQALATGPCGNLTEEIRLDKKAKLTVYNQGASGHCYAAASAVLYNVYRDPNGKTYPREVSPIHLASVFKSSIETEGLPQSGKWGKIAGNLGGGDPVSLFGKALRVKPRPVMCSQKGTEKVWKDFMRIRYGEAFAKQVSTDDFMKYLERLYGNWWYYIRNSPKRDFKKGFEEMERVRTDLTGGNFAALEEDGDHIVAPKDPCKAVPLQEQPALETLIGDMKHILHFDQPHNGQKGLINFLRAQVDEMCPWKERISPPEFPEPMVARAVKGSKAPIATFIESQLCQNSAPAALSICVPGFLQGAAKVDKEGKQLKCLEDCKDPKTCQSSDHVVAVVGRRVTAGKVQYLVQNSWGPGCVYNKELNKNCDAEGRLWIDAEALVDRTVRATGLPKSPVK